MQVSYTISSKKKTRAERGEGEYVVAKRPATIFGMKEERWENQQRAGARILIF